MSLISAIPRWEIVDKTGKLLVQWQGYLSQIDAFLIRNVGNNGATSGRPTSNLYVGLQYFDTTLGYPVWIKSLNPTVWVRYDGTPE